MIACTELLAASHAAVNHGQVRTSLPPVHRHHWWPSLGILLGAARGCLGSRKHSVGPLKCTAVH